MVALSEVTNTFWGVTLDGDGKRYSQVVENDFHISMAALEISSSKNVKDGSYVSVMIQQDNTEFLLCTLQYGKLLQQPLDLNFAEGEEITFFLNGKGVVHLTGYLMEANVPDSIVLDQEEEVESEEYSSDEEPPNLVRRGITAKEYEESDEELPTKGKRKKKDVGASKVKKAKVEESEESSYEEEEEDEEMDSDDLHSDDLDSDELDFLDDEAEECSDEDDDEDEDEEEDEEELIRMSGSFLKADKSAKQKQKKQVGKTDKGTPKPEKNTPVAKQQDKKQTPGGKKQMQAGQKQTPAGQKQTPAGQKQTPAGQKQTPAGQKQTPAGQKQTPAGQKQTPAGQKEETSKKSDSATPSSSEHEMSSEKKKKKKKKKKQKQQKTEQETPNNKIDSKTSTPAKTPKQTPGGDADRSSQKKTQKRVLEGGVLCEESKEGHGPTALHGKTVHVYYTGKLENGKIFDSTTEGKPFRFKLGLNEVIRGWDIGIKGMKVGGKRKLVIPAKMAYGKEKVGNIPPNSTLIFDVELKSVS